MIFIANLASVFPMYRRIMPRFCVFGKRLLRNFPFPNWKKTYTNRNSTDQYKFNSRVHTFR